MSGRNTILDQMVEKLCLRYQPEYIRRYKYWQVKQIPGESFDQFWTRKVIAGQESNQRRPMLHLSTKTMMTVVKPQSVL